MTFYKSVVRPLLFKLDAEKAHTFVMDFWDTLAATPLYNLWRSCFRFEDKALNINVLGLQFSNPLGLAAGFDKNATHVKALSSLGFGFIEVGTVTYHPQTGNSKPRIKRLVEEESLWNYLGFNNDGAEAVVSSLQRTNVTIPIGINLGKSRVVPLDKAVNDYVASFQLLLPYGDYFVLNVSSPNTPDLRLLQEEENLKVLLTEFQKKNQRRKPILIKIAPDLSFDQIDSLLNVALQFDVQGVIATNTTLSREGVKTNLPDNGGISGSCLRRRSTEVIRHIYRSIGKKLCIIGSGGVFKTEDALEKIRAGASLIQIYTGLIYQGPSLIKSINMGLSSYLKQNGIDSIREIVGCDV